MTTPGQSEQTETSSPQQLKGRSPRPFQRFMTGLGLGLILVLVWGSFVSLLAQPQGWVTANMQAQLLPNTGDAIPAAPPAPTANPTPSPTDIGGHWAADCITALAQRGILPPNGAGAAGRQFYPNEAATWATLTTWLNRSFPPTESYGGASPAEAALQLPSPVNVLYYLPPQYYAPDRPVTRATAISALAAKAQLPFIARGHELLTASLEDGDRIPVFGREGVAAALAQGIVVNYPTPQRLDGTRPITRGELAALVCQANPDSALRRTIAPEWVAAPAPLPPQAQPEREVRGVWLTNIDSDVLFSQEKLAEGIQRLKALNINTLYPVVWNMGYTQFPSATAELVLGKKQRLWPGENPAFERAQGDRDMLQELITLAHAEGMAVIPWFEFGFMAPADYVMRDRRPEWFTQRRDGTQEIQMGAETFTWMNPFHPQTRRLLLLLMGEILDNSEVEGIQVDDHLGLPIDMGYDSYTVGLYQQEHGGQMPPADPSDAEWMRWRADKITGFMGEVRQLLNQRQPGAVLSVSPNPYPFAYAQYLQDWPAWEAAGWLDEIIIQIYRDDVDRFVWELNKPAAITASRRTPTSIGLLSGLRERPTDVALLTAQLEAVRDRTVAGVSYFFYQTLWTPGSETPEERDRQFKAGFTTPVARP
ncbi:MAG TPA: family 10 glycosylhydrolase [Candidatus Obscuribacterales bacterium]